MEKKKIISIVLVVLCLAYCIAPIDIIPDVLPIVGWIDDLGVIGATLATVLNTLKSAKSEVNNKGKNKSDSSAQSSDDGKCEYNDVSSN